MIFVTAPKIEVDFWARPRFTFESRAEAGTSPRTYFGRLNVE
jgi:hypothetical protein